MRMRASHFLKIFSFVIAVVMTVLTLSLNVFAAENSTVEEENKALKEELIGVLTDKLTENFNTDIGSTVNSNHLWNAIDRFSGLKEEDNKLPETADKIRLYYYQGVAINEVAWIYYTYAEDLQGEAKQRVDDTFKSIDTAIANYTDHNELSGSINSKGGLCAQMLACIYSEKLDALLTDGDSEAVKKIVADAKGILPTFTTNSFDDHSDYANLFENTSLEVTIQRNRDKTLAELEGVLDVFYGEGGYEDKEFYKNAVAVINDDETDEISEMNAALLDAFGAAADELSYGKGNYVNAYYEKRDPEQADACIDETMLPEELLILGTNPREIFHGREGAKCLLQGDWKYWGQLTLDVERTALSQAGNALYFVMRGQIKLDIWRFHLPIKITGVLEKRDNLWYISKLQFINDLNTNYVILAWVPAIALVASLVLFALSWLPAIF